jgi:epoxyqueuosine reductase
MTNQIAKELIAEAEKWDGIQGRIADISNVMNSPSYKAVGGEQWQDDHAEQTIQWLANARSLLILGMHHAKENPELDWFDRGNTSGNRWLTKISKILVEWLHDTHGIKAQALPYQVDRGGAYLKDAACLAGLGVIGRNNLLIHPRWGPQIRLRSVLIQDYLPPSTPLENFNPCYQCPMPCRKACPENAFAQGRYHRPSCMLQLESDRANQIESGHEDAEGAPHLVTAWCRRCEFACPVGSD